MKLIALTGLVSIEKRDLTLELAQHYRDTGQRVAIVDNIARLPIDPELTGGETLLRVEGDITPNLAALLENSSADIVILAVSERMHPETWLAALDNLREIRPDIEAQTTALIDLRTCDCFPNVRELLERYADKVVMLPYRLAQVVEGVG